MKRRGSKDGNHDALRDRFIALGCSVADLHAAGVAGWPDIVAGVVGLNALVELKNPDTRYGRAGLNANQSAFARDWRGGQVYVVSTPDEVDALVRNLRSQHRGSIR